jgi:hypothetical protein
VNVFVCVLCGYVPVNIVMSGSVSRSGCCVFMRVRMCLCFEIFPSTCVSLGRGLCLRLCLYIYMSGCVCLSM